MPKTIDIKTGITPFEDSVDTSRNNPNRKPWGKGDSDFHVNDEYDTTPEESAPPTPPPPQKVTHKLANGVVLEADSMEELAQKMEKALAPPPPEAKWDETPVYTPMEFKPRQLSVQEEVDLLNRWPKTPQKAMRELQEAEFGATMEQIIKRLNMTEMIVMQRAQEEEGVNFLMEVAETYSATKDNADKLTAYLKEKGKPITKNNLVRAFKEMSPTHPELLRTPEPAAKGEEGEEFEPPTIVASNMGEPPVAAPPGVDIEAFKKMNVKQQKDFFAQLRARGVSRQ